MSGVKLNEASLEKKLYHAEPTQQGIQALTKWITGHKDHYQKIVELWRKILKKSQPKHRLTLFYVANDVIQYARRKKVNDLYTILKGAIREVVPLLREDSILPSVQRVLSVWLDREIFEEEYVQELRDALDKQKLQAAQNAKIVERFKPSEMTEKIKEMMKREEENEKRLKTLKLVKVDVSSPEAIQQIKDRMHGTKHCNDFEDACSKLEDYVTSLAEQIQLQKDVGDRLIQSQVYYEHQYGEAKIVANAYKNFSLRVNNLRKRLAEFIKILPDPEEPEPEALSPEYDAPSPGNTPPPDLTKDHIMDEHMDVSDGEEQEPNLVFENEKSSPYEPESGTGGGSDGEESNSSFDVDALLEKEFDNSPQATPSQKRKKRYTISMEPQSPPPTPRPQHPAVASFLNTSYKTESNRSSSANSSPGRNTDGALSRNPPSALDQRLAALTAKGGETMMSLFGGLEESRDDDDVVSNGSQGESDLKSPKSGEKRPYASSPERNGGDRTPTRDEGEFERASKSMRTSSPISSRADPVPQKGPHTPIGPHTPSGSEPHTPTTSSECGTPVRTPFFPPGAPIPPTPPPSIAILNPGIQTATIGTPPPKKPQPPVFKTLTDDTVPPLPPPPPFPIFLNLNASDATSNGSPAASSESPSAQVSAANQQREQNPPQSPANPQQLQQQIPTSQHHSPATPHSTPLSAPGTPLSSTPLSAPGTPLISASTLAGLVLSQPPPPIPIAPMGLGLSLATPIIPLTSIPVSGVAMSGVGAAGSGVIETPSANFDKSDQVLFKAQDEFLKRLKEKSAKGSKPSLGKVAALAGMTLTLPPKPTKSPPPSFPPTTTTTTITPKSGKSPSDPSLKEEKQPTIADMDLRLGNVDLKKLSKDIDAIMKKESSKEGKEELLKKDYQPTLKSPETKGEDVPIQDVDMRRDKSKQGEPKKKRLSIVRPPPSVISKPPPSTATKDEPSESRRSLSSSSASTEDKRKFEGESSDGAPARGESRDGRDGAPARGESQSSRSESRDASTEKESVWRRLSSETFSQRESKDGKAIAKEDVRRYSEMCDDYYRTYYEEQYGSGGKARKHSGGGHGSGSHNDSHGSGSSGGSRRNEDRYEDRHQQQGGDQVRDHHHDYHHGERYYGDDGDDRRWNRG